LKRSALVQPNDTTGLDYTHGFAVAVTLVVKEGESDAVAAKLKELVPPTMAEPGVKLFLPYRSPTDPLLFFVFELYADEAAWVAHQATEHFKSAISDILPRVSRRERIPFLPLLAAPAAGAEPMS
jgi:quinol monooxygenase YgiN